MLLTSSRFTSSPSAVTLLGHSDQIAWLKRGLPTFSWVWRSSPDRRKGRLIQLTGPAWALWPQELQEAREADESSLAACSQWPSLGMMPALCEQ